MLWLSVSSANSTKSWTRWSQHRGIADESEMGWHIVSYTVMNGTPNGFHDGYDVGLGGEVFDTEKSFELLKRNRDGGACHESDDGGMREELDEEP